jgi:GNAT superfamily N-acetyltransferase
MSSEEIDRAKGIDATESGTTVYYYRDGEIVKEDEEWHRPRWDDAEARRHLESAALVLERGGAILGAFDEDILVGFATLLYKLEGDMAQLADLQVSVDHRRKGIATRLVEEVLKLAEERGAGSIYVSATPSESAIGFYKSMGFGLAEKVNRELYELEPEDIHMTRTL